MLAKRAFFRPTAYGGEKDVTRETLDVTRETLWWAKGFGLPPGTNQIRLPLPPAQLKSNVGEPVPNRPWIYFEKTVGVSARAFLHSRIWNGP